MTPREIETQIENTRSNMAETLAQLERKLSPETIMDQAVDTMRDFTKDTSIQGVIRDNPVPATILGLGLGWMAYRAYKSRQTGFDGGHYGDESGAFGLSNVVDRVKSNFGSNSRTERFDEYGNHSLSDQAKAGLHRAADSLGRDGNLHDAKHRVADGLHDAKDRMADGLHNAKEKIADGLHTARDKVSDVGDQARHYTRKATRATRESFDEHPLAMGLAALVAGIALGALLPRSNTEHRMLGNSVDKVVSKARHIGSDLAEKAGNVADRTLRAAKEEGQAAYNDEIGDHDRNRRDGHDHRYH